jgi:hypothetical protein
MLLLALTICRVPQPYFGFIIAFQCYRVALELQNHAALARVFNTPDAYALTAT